MKFCNLNRSSIFALILSSFLSAFMTMGTKAAQDASEKVEKHPRRLSLLCLETLEEEKDRVLKVPRTPLLISYYFSGYKLPASRKAKLENCSPNSEIKMDNLYRQIRTYLFQNNPKAH